MSYIQLNPFDEYVLTLIQENENNSDFDIQSFVQNAGYSLEQLLDSAKSLHSKALLKKASTLSDSPYVLTPLGREWNKPAKTGLTVITEASETMIQNMIYIVRGQQVMLDSDLAMLYNVDTKVLNQAVSRNIARFPERFRFRLTKDEFDNLRSQIVTSSLEDNHGGRRYLPYVFTEQGIAMLSSVLRSDTAVQVSIRIMDTFVEMRKYLASNTYLLERVYNIESRQIESEKKRSEFEKNAQMQFEQIFDYIASREESNQKVFFEGQIFDAFSLMVDLVGQADKTIELIDGYVDVVTLNILAKKKTGVDVFVYTLPNARLTNQDIQNFNAQYPSLEVKHTNAFHDRFLVLDSTKAYHIGASIKDAGKKCFGINKIEDADVINNILQKAKLTAT